MKRYFFEGAQRATGHLLRAMTGHSERMAATDGYVLLDRQLGYDKPLGVAVSADLAQRIVDALNREDAA